MDDPVNNSYKNDYDAMNADSTIIVLSNDNKRKRNSTTSAHFDNFMKISDDDNCTNIDSIALLEALITPNFEELARQFVEFRHAYHNVLSIQRHGQNNRHTISDNQQQFSNNNNNNTLYNSFQSCITQEFTIALTKALLHVHINGLSIKFIPNDQLCPPVPNRYFFVQWIQNTLLPLVHYSTRNKASNSITSYSYFEEENENNNLMSNNDEPNTPIVGIDIGTGATCIYPLLFAATSSCETFMYATDIDEVSINYAKENVQCNPNYSSKIHITLVPPSDQQIQYEQQEQQQEEVEDEMITTEEFSTDNSTVTGTRSPQTYRIGPLRQSYNKCLLKQSTSESDTDTRFLPRKIDFCMTNPPFYDSMNPIEYNEVLLSNTSQRRDGRQRTVLKVSEGLYPGGEVAFILDTIVDGLYLFLTSKSQPIPPQLLLLPPEPVWSCCMIGKRASHIRLQHILEQFLGYGHVQTTEFGPGQLTRWFLAWTFTKRPCIRSPNAKIESDTFHGTKWSFTVNTLSTAIPSTRTNDNNQKEWNSMNEVLKRIEEYCSTFPGHNLCSKAISVDVEPKDFLPHTVEKYHSNHNSIQVEIWEERTEPLSYPWPGDEILPFELQQVLETATASSDSLSPLSSAAVTNSTPFLLNAAQRTHFFIPRRGHFLIDMKLDTINDIYSTKSSGMIYVQIIASYRHTTYGMNMMKVIKNQFEGEICRTNRKWRRKLQHHQQPTTPHMQQVQQYADQENNTMDGS